MLLPLGSNCGTLKPAVTIALSCGCGCAVPGSSWVVFPPACADFSNHPVKLYHQEWTDPQEEYTRDFSHVDPSTVTYARFNS